MHTSFIVLLVHRNVRFGNLFRQGFVSDGNSYALGGISGHAGLYSSALTYTLSSVSVFCFCQQYYMLLQMYMNDKHTTWNMNQMCCLVRCPKVSPPPPPPPPGLFSRVSDIYTLLHHLVFASSSDPWINSTTVHAFTTVCQHGTRH